MSGKVNLFFNLLFLDKPSFLDKPEINETASSTELWTFIDNYQPIYLKCIANGVPEPTYTWNHPGGYQKAGDKSTFVLQNPRPLDFGKYTCTASNTLGAAKHVVEVKKIGIYTQLLLYLS